MACLPRILVIILSCFSMSVLSRFSELNSVGSLWSDVASLYYPSFLIILIVT